MASPPDVDRAVASARTVFPAWKAMAGDKRRDLMFRLAALLEQKSTEFLPALVAENGSIAMTAPYMGHDAAQKFCYFGGWADKIHGRMIPMWGAPAHDYVSYNPFGVIGIIVPWNGPMFAATMALAPALAAGNCVILKAPDLAPYSVMQLVELIHDAGFPAGVVNLVTGGADIGETMVANPGVDKIQFIGLGATARKVLTKAAETLKPCGLELGGKSAVIIFADADLQAWEYKGKHRDLAAAHRQLLLYAGALGNPPLLVVSDIERIIIRTNWTNAVSERHEILLADIADANKRAVLKAVFSDPERLRPGKTRAALTTQAAEQFAELATRLRARGHAPQTVAHFVNRLVFCMFADSDEVRLLPSKLFKDMLAASRRKPARFADFARQLFAAMAERDGLVGVTEIPWFNGGLFDDDTALPLEADDISLLQRAAELDWAEIDPSIMGTLFERGLDPDKRSQLGAHYTG